MSSPPLVSILIPNYNKSSYLRETLDSVIAQTYPNWECIVVDDQSTDGSWEILESYAQKDARIKIFKRPDNRKKGGNAARNIAIEKANGEYIAFLDSDDIWNSRRLELSVRFISRNHFSAIYSGAVISNGNKRTIQHSREMLAKESVFDFIVNEDTFSQTSTLVLKSEIAKRVHFDENMLRHQDFDFFIRVSWICDWRYFENFDVLINWTSIKRKKVNFETCIPFYEKHWNISSDKSVRHNYIRRLVSLSARRNPNKVVTEYFRKILVDEGYHFSLKEKVLFNLPYVFHHLSRIISLFRD